MARQMPITTRHVSCMPLPTTADSTETCAGTRNTSPWTFFQPESSREPPYRTARAPRRERGHAYSAADTRRSRVCAYIPGACTVVPARIILIFVVGGWL